jgi:hypothetical protein
LLLFAAGLAGASLSTQISGPFCRMRRPAPYSWLKLELQKKPFIAEGLLISNVKNVSLRDA